MRFKTLACGLLMTSLVVEAKNPKKAQPKPPEDQIEVIGHIALNNASVSRFLTTQHYSSHYLYAEHETGGMVTLIDVTQAARPLVLGDTAMPSGSLFVVAGTAALSTEGATTAAQAATPKTVNILNFSEPTHPTVSRSFTGVTAMGRDERRGLIFVANGEGVWILRQKLADDPEEEKAYAHKVIYDH